LPRLVITVAHRREIMAWLPPGSARNDHYAAGSKSEGPGINAFFMSATNSIRFGYSCFD
jgi:hypothetical protein